MHFLSEDLEQYIKTHSERETELLYNLNRETWEKVINPRMLSGHVQGRVLSMLSHMIKPNHILEIGTYTGYSAICLAEGLTDNGSIDTIDINEELENLVVKYITQAQLTSKINYHIGDASRIIPQLQKTYDLIFIDADKINYSLYYDLVFDKLAIGGFIIADNVLWSGKVVEPIKPDDIDTKSILTFNNNIQNDNRVQNVLFPIRDGLMVIRKISN